jgi:AcrR family transcriptional regulator
MTMNSFSKRMIYQTDSTRGHIIDVATSLFTESGFFETHMRDIAAKAGLSRTSLYRYFRDKLDLGFAILDRIWRKFEASTPWPPQDAILPAKAIERLAIHLRARWLAPELKREYAFMAEFDSYFSGRRLPSDFKNRIGPSVGSAGPSVLQDLIEQGIEDGSIRSDVDPHLTTVTILNSLRGLQQRLILRGDALIELESGDRDRMCDELLKYLCAGIANKA